MRSIDPRFADHKPPSPLFFVTHKLV